MNIGNQLLNVMILLSEYYKSIALNWLPVINYLIEIKEYYMDFYLIMAQKFLIFRATGCCFIFSSDID